MHASAQRLPRLAPYAAIGIGADAWASVGSCGHYFSSQILSANCSQLAPPQHACGECGRRLFYFLPCDTVLTLTPRPTLVSQSAPCQEAEAYNALYAGERRSIGEYARECVVWMRLSSPRLRVASALMILAAAAYFVLDADLVPDHTRFGRVDDAAVVVCAIAVLFYVFAHSRPATVRAVSQRAIAP